MATREELEGELAPRTRVRELEAELAGRAAAEAPEPAARAVPRAAARAVPRPAPAAPPPAPIVEPLPPVGPARPAATYRSLAGRAAQLRLAGEVDKAVLVERQIDAMVARERRVAAAQARDSAAQEALVKGRAAAAEAWISASSWALDRASPAPDRAGITAQIAAAVEHRDIHDDTNDLTVRAFVIQHMLDADVGFLEVGFP